MNKVVEIAEEITFEEKVDTVDISVSLSIAQDSFSELEEDRQPTGAYKGASEN